MPRAPWKSLNLAQTTVAEAPPLSELKTVTLQYIAADPAFSSDWKTRIAEILAERGESDEADSDDGNADAKEVLTEVSASFGGGKSSLVRIAEKRAAAFHKQFPQYLDGRIG